MPPQPRVFFDFSVDDQPLGRVVFELFTNVVPKTAENFRALCTGSRGISAISNIPLHYKSSTVHRVVDGFMIQGGDFTRRNGSGGESIYGGAFEDERLQGDGTEVDKPGLLVMANRGPNTNGSQWFITLGAAPHLTGKHVVFGRVVGGFEHIQVIGRLPTGDKDRPLSRVVIIHCGELELRKSLAKALTPEGSLSPPRHRKSQALSGDRERKLGKEKLKKVKKAREETEEELDARLEREENDRLEAARLEKLAEMNRQLEEKRQRIKEAGGVVYKGRGAMRFSDPESALTRKAPRFNYDPRAPDTRPRRGAGPQTTSGGKWQHGTDFGRPSFDKSALDRDLDRYGTKRQREGGESEEGRVADDWRAGRRPSPGAERTDIRRRTMSPVREKSPDGVRMERDMVASPTMRPESPLRGDRSDGSDMMIEEDD